MKDTTIEKLLGKSGIHFARRTQSWAIRPANAKILRAILHFIMGVCLSNGVIFGRTAPFGVAFAAAGGTGVMGISGFIGTLFGYIFLWDSFGGLTYAAASILVFIVSLIFAEQIKKDWFMPTVAVAALAVIHFVFIFNRNSQSAVLFFVELVLVGGATLFYKTALQDSLTVNNTSSANLRRGISLIILFSTVLISLHSLTIAGFLSTGRLAALLIVMFLALRGGAGTGAAGGLTVGLAMDLAWGMPYFSMAYGFSGMLAGSAKEHGRLLSICLFITSHAAATLFLTNPIVRAAVLFEAFAASVLFMLVPESVLGRLKKRYLLHINQTPAVAAEVAIPAVDRMQKRAAVMLEQAASAFNELHNTLECAMSVPDTDTAVSDEARIIDRVCKRVCDKCALRRICWEKEFDRTCDALRQVASSLHKNRKVVNSDFANWFQHRCMSFQQFCDAVNEESLALFYNRRFASRLKESRGLVSHQYAETSRLLRSMTNQIAQGAERFSNAEDRVKDVLAARHNKASCAVSRIHGRVLVEVEGYDLTPLYNDRRGLTDELSQALKIDLNLPERQTVGKMEQLIFSQCEPIRMQVGSAARQKEGESVSGDSGVYFKLPDGRMVVLLSDGMGSGSKAAAESSWVVRLLETFIRVGIAPDTALRTINSALLIKGNSEGVFVTVDLLIINLLNGEAAFYKFGAAPSYVKRGDRVHRVSCNILPAGIAVENGLSLDVTKITLTNDSLVVVASDGIADPGNDEWLQAILQKSCHLDCKAIAAQILDTAKFQNGGRDDMSVLVLRACRR